MRPILLAVLVGVGCSDEPCVTPPCPQPLALQVTILPPAGQQVVATVAVTGPIVETFSCSATCPVLGPSGTYAFDVTASGFAPVHESIEVHGTQPKCGCEVVQTQAVQVALVAVP